jgi:hypothetical protein
MTRRQAGGISPFDLLVAGLLITMRLAPAGAQSAEQTNAGESTGSTTAEAMPTPAVATEDNGFRFLRFGARARLISRVTIDTKDGHTSFDQQNARAELRWMPARWLRGVFEVDVATQRLFKDVYVRFRGRGVGLHVGQFKPPVAALEMKTRWDISSCDRGLVHDVLVEAMGWAGRRPGAMIALTPKGRFEALIGVFRSSHVRGDRLGDEAFNNLVDDWSPSKQRIAARVVGASKRLRIGFSGEWKPAEPIPDEGYQRDWLLNADAAWFDGTKRGGRRIWAEAFVGSSWQDANAFDADHATFLAGRVVCAWRRGGKKTGRVYLEPYMMISMIDPDVSIREDVMWEIVTGVNAGSWRRVRLSLEVQHRRISRNVPLALGIIPRGVAPPTERTRLLLQVGSAL